jgi:streptogramin lyase
MSNLKPVLEKIRDGFVPPQGALERLLVRRVHKHRSQRLAAAVVALVLSGAAVTGLWSVIRVAPRPTSLPGVLPGQAIDVAVGEGSVWVLTCNRRCGDDGRRSEGSLVRIDPVTKQALASAHVARPHALAVSEAAVWVVDFWGSKVTRFDPRTMHQVASIQLRLPFAVCQSCPDVHDFVPWDVAVGDGAVWVSTGRGVLARIDPSTNAVGDIVRLPGDTTGEVAAGEGAVWVTENVQGLFRIDPSTNRVVVVRQIHRQAAGRRRRDPCP